MKVVSRDMRKDTIRQNFQRSFGDLSHAPKISVVEPGSLHLQLLDPFLRYFFQRWNHHQNVDFSDEYCSSGTQCSK